MNPAVNPYAPGAGTPPPELAGRDAILADAKLAIGRNKGGKSARGDPLASNALPKRNRAKIRPNCRSQEDNLESGMEQLCAMRKIAALSSI